METYLINEKKQAGGNSYKEYTWDEVLKYFLAPEDISDVDELKQWYESEEGVAFDYIITPWRNSKGEIL